MTKQLPNERQWLFSSLGREIGLIGKKWMGLSSEHNNVQ